MTERPHPTDAELQDVGTRWDAAMRAGDWEAAWQQTDRIEMPRRELQRTTDFAPGPQHLRWDGTPLAGRSVMVRCLHGLGDTLQFMRFAPQLAAQARELHFLVQPMLLDLLKGLPGLGQVSNAWTDDPPPHEVEIEVMELAYALRCTADRVPPPLPDLATHVREQQVFVLPAPPHQRKLALFHAASRWDTSRSIPLEHWLPLLDVPGARFHDLQQDVDPRPALPPSRMTALHRQTQDIVAAAAALQEMDLVIAVDGMPAHLAASLGRPTWLLLKHDADWRWGKDLSDSPWYPSMRIFRQPEPGDWAGLMTQVREALISLPAPSSAAPASTSLHPLRAR